jgi:nucleotide-binding universal stress UspA family protein
MLVPLDGSSFGEQALPLAVSLARKAGATLRLAHVHTPVVYVEGLVAVDNMLDQRARDEEQAYLERVARRLEPVLQAPIAVHLLDGPIPDGLQEHAAAVKADLVVMTTHGRGPFSRFWLGSVADQLVRRSTVPLLLVRPPEEAEAAPSPNGATLFRHVLIPLDGSPLAEQVLEPAVSLGWLSDADFTLLRVVTPPSAYGYDPAAVVIAGGDAAVLEQMQSEAWTYLERIAGPLRARGLTVETRVLIDAQPPRAILDLAGARNSDLVALATHGRGGLERLLLGSVADKLVRAAHVPVLVVRPQAKGKGE